MTTAALLTATTVVQPMDYGQFVIDGGTCEADELALLTSAMNRPPSASDGAVVVVTNPHQNNFAARVDVEVWSARPAPDISEWEQVSLETIAVGSGGTVWLGSPTMESTICAVPPGTYAVEISGRGFVNYGWPGSTTPGDEWRLRFWPGTAPNDAQRVVWQQPGFGTPWGDQNAHA